MDCTLEYSSSLSSMRPSLFLAVRMIINPRCRSFSAFPLSSNLEQYDYDNRNAAKNVSLVKAVKDSEPFIPRQTIFAYRVSRKPRNEVEKIEVKEAKMNGRMSRVEQLILNFTVFSAIEDSFVNVSIARPATEKLSDSLDRIAINTSNCVIKREDQIRRQNKKKSECGVKKSHLAIDYKISCANYEQFSKLDIGTAISELYSLTIGTTPYRIIYKVSPIQFVTLPLLPRVGFPVVPLLQYRDELIQTPEFGDHLDREYRFFWYVSSSSEPLLKNRLNFPPDSDIPTLEGCEFRSDKFIFIPNQEDVGKYVAVVVAFNDTPSIALIAKGTMAIENGEERLLADEKMKWAQKKRKEINHNSLIVLSYNVLAETNWHNKSSYYPYCSKEVQDIAYRHPSLFKELIAYDADLMFLQEVCPKMMKSFLPCLWAHTGHSSFMREKYLQVKEGGAIAWKKSRFQDVSHEQYWLTDILEEEENADIRDFLDKHPYIMEKFTSRPTALQTVYLRDVNTCSLILAANTHLHPYPIHETIKALQAALVYRKLAKIVEEVMEPVKVVIGCDLNSLPNAPAYRLWSNGHLKEKDSTWMWEDEKLIMKMALHLTIPRDKLLLKNLSGTELTNFAEFVSGDERKEFSGCIDYIWGSGLILEEKAPQPSIEMLREFTALPSKVAPSDHLSIILHLKYD